MQVRELMTENPVCCTENTALRDVAQMMIERDVGSIPVVESEETKKPVGIVTDRDIVSRAVAEGENPQNLTAGDSMTHQVVTVTPETNLEDCCNTMEENQIRRVPVVDEQGGCCGMVAQADIALKTGERETAEVVQEVSQPMRAPSDVSSRVG